MTRTLSYRLICHDQFTMFTGTYPSGRPAEETVSCALTRDAAADLLLASSGVVEPTFRRVHELVSEQCFII
jgi:hypothetical protein